MNTAKSTSSDITIACLLACYNRRGKTLACLERLTAQRLPADVKLRIFLLDDGSTDGTGEAVRASYPQARILYGNGQLFWCGGMRSVWKEAAREDPEYYLLLNDDTFIEPSAVSDLLSIIGSPDALAIATGAIVDSNTGIQIYGGHRGRNVVPAIGQIERCDTMNANCALVPRAVYRKIGRFHPAYTHAMGDFDYGFEANRRGIPVFQSARPIGSCSGNPTTGSWRDANLSRRKRLRALQSPKGLPWREWLCYTWRNGGWGWPVMFLSPFVRILLGK